EDYNFFSLKYELYKFILEKDSNHLYINDLNLFEKKYYNEFNFLTLMNYFIEKKKLNPEIYNEINNNKSIKNKFFNKEKMISSFNNKIMIEYNYVYKLYFAYFF